MATTLQQQLAAIAAKSTHQLDLKAQKAQHSKSLLFEPRDAASQSFDTIYQLCIEGFEELCQLDVRFAAFAKNLFSEQSKSEDRTQMTAKENAQLDQIIIRFLGLLGGRMLLKPALKAAEWMVRRFRVHEYNTEAIILTFLPYHQSHIFSTLLSILPDQLPPNFRFLHPYVASRQCPPRHSIVAATSNSPALFAALSQFVLGVARARHHSALLLGFWASVTAQAVNGMVDASRSGREGVRRQKEEDLLLKVLPVLQEALSIKGVPELYLGSCMIMTILATKSSVSDKVLNAMMEAVATGWTGQTVEDGLVCLAVLAEEKEELSPLPDSITNAILDYENAVDTLDRTAARCRVHKLLTSTSLGLVHRGKDAQAVQFLNATLEGAVLSEGDKVKVLQGLLAQSRSSPHLKQILGSLSEQEGALQLLDAAAREANFDLAGLDDNLVLKLDLGDDADDVSDESDAMDVDEAENTRPREKFNTLPELLSTSASFLAPDMDDVFAAYATSFRQASTSSADVSKLMSRLNDQNSPLQHPTALSFLARLWSCDAQTIVRAKALRVAAELLRSDRNDQSTDLQALTSYAICALGDFNKAVRSGAAAVIVAMTEAFKVDSQNAKSALDAAAWCQDTIYGESSAKVHQLPTSESHKLLAEVITPVLEDCLIDPRYLATALSDAINGSSPTNKTTKKELKSASRTDIYAYLASHLIYTPVDNVKIHLSAILCKVGKAAGIFRSKVLLQYIRTYVGQQTHDTTAAAIDPAVCQALIGCLTHRSADEVELLKELASGQEGGAIASKFGFARLQHLWPSISEPQQAGVLDWMLSLIFASSVDDDVQSNAVETLRSLTLPTSALVHLVEDLPSVQDVQPTPAKKQRTSRASDIPKPGSIDKGKLGLAIRRITTVLELVESSKPERHPQLLKVLFHLLNELHHYKTVLDSDLIYLQSLLVNSLLSVVNGLKAGSNKDIDRSVIRPDLIVDCVRSTSNTQVHQSALLLMSALASWAPDLVLHSVMPLFTFMSSTILKQGDDYSAHVTDQTVARIIPPLAASLKKRGRDLITGAADLLLSFTAAFEHIPLHRRANLFQHLVQTLGAKEALFAIMAMLVERYPDDERVRPFVADLMDKFSANIQLTAVAQYLDLVSDTLKPKRALSDVILGYSEKTREQATEASVTLFDGLAIILNGQLLRKRLAKELRSDNVNAGALRSTYSIVLEKTMQLGLQLKVDQSLQPSVNELLSSVLGLMPSKDFIDSSAKLMQTGSDEIRQQVFRSLEQRVQTARHGDSALQQVFIDVVPNCVVFVAESQPVDTRSAAIACVDRIADKFGKTDRAAIKGAAVQVAGDAALGSHDSGLRRLSLLCLASMVEVLGDEFIALLPQTLEKALKYLQQTLSESDVNQRLLAACFSFGIAVLDHVPWMLSGSYLDRLLVLAAEADDASARQFSTLAARKIAVDEILRAIGRTFEDVVALGADAVRLHLTTLRQIIQHHPKSMVTKNAQPLFAILTKAFDLRQALDEGEDDGDVDEVYDLVNNTTMDAVLKLNDATFRPFFIRLSEWSATSASKQEQNKRILRQTSFYSFALILFDQLKSLVTTYVSYILDDTASILRSSHKAKGSAVDMIKIVVRALSSNFSHDDGGFWQAPAHFDVIAGPLLDLLELVGDVDLEEKHIISAIVELASASNSPEHHKTIDDKLLALMKHEDAAVRLAAVKAERALTERLSFDWCNFIPTWLPAIAELQEDDYGAVERETLRWMEQIQGVTGESVNDMLR